MIHLSAAAEASAPEVVFHAPPPVIDWPIIMLLGGGISVAAIFTLLAAWLLHRYRGHWKLRWRSIVSGALPVLVIFSIVLAVGVIADNKPIDRAIFDLLGMPPEAWTYFFAMFAICTLAGAALGWWLRRRIAKSNHIDPSVFG